MGPDLKNSVLTETNRMTLCWGSERKWKNAYGKNDEYKNRGEHIYKEKRADSLCCLLSFQRRCKGNNTGKNQPDAGYRSKSTVYLKEKIWYYVSSRSKFNAWGKIMEFLDSEMMKRFMHSAPVNIFFKDTECRYCFASEICDLVSVGENGSIVGKTDLEIQKFPEMGKMYYEDDKKILATGEDSQYISEFPMEDGESLYFEIKKSAVRDENGNIIGIVGIVDNVTERVRLEKKVEELSIIDDLTGVYNRNYLKYRVEEKKKKLIFPFTVIMSDCNYLKKVNDQYGHEYGDILLKIVADTLKEEMPEDFPVIRMGGDEFMILCNGITEEKASELMANIRESLKRKSKENIPLSLAMGSYTVQSKEFSFDEVCHEADLRMYADKKRLKADESTEITE